MTMSPGLRKFALAVHLTVSVGWIGAIAAYAALDVPTVASQDAETLRTAYLGMDSIARSVIVPLAAASLLTGLVVSLGTKWGLMRHYWVLISLVLTMIAMTVLLMETQVISSHADMAADPTTSASVLRAMPSTLVHSVGGTVVLLVILVLNIYKPQGLTRYGWRKQQEQRRKQQSSVRLCCSRECRLPLERPDRGSARRSLPGDDRRRPHLLPGSPGTIVTGSGR